MAEFHQNILYVTRPNVYLRHELESVRVVQGDETLLRVPLHHLQGITIFGYGGISPSLLHKCLSAGVFVTYLTERGKFLGRLEGAGSGNVLVRIAQLRASDDPVRRLELARRIVAGKLQNSRLNLLRSARGIDDEAGVTAIYSVTSKLEDRLVKAKNSQSLEELRGHEGESARLYFSVLNHGIIQQKDSFSFDRRTRRPPRSRLNALLSFAYAMVTNDCLAACQSTGLDPYVGFLHDERPGRPALALDLAEEFRPFADRFVLTMINRKQVKGADFTERPGSVFQLTDSGRKTFLTAYQERKQDELMHPVIGEKTKAGQLPFIQARLMARAIRGDTSGYIPYVWK